MLVFLYNKKELHCIYFKVHSSSLEKNAWVLTEGKWLIINIFGFPIKLPNERKILNTQNSKRLASLELCTIEFCEFSVDLCHAHKRKGKR